VPVAVGIVLLRDALTKRSFAAARCFELGGRSNPIAGWLVIDHKLGKGGDAGRRILEAGGLKVRPGL